MSLLSRTSLFQCCDSIIYIQNGKRVSMFFSGNSGQEADLHCTELDRAT